MPIIYGIDAVICNFVQFGNAQACNAMRIYETEKLAVKIELRRLLYFVPTSSAPNTLEITLNPPLKTPIRNRMIKNIQ